MITGFGRTGASFGAERSAAPDIMTTAKGLTNGVIPMGGIRSRGNLRRLHARARRRHRAVPRLYRGHPALRQRASRVLKSWRRRTSSGRPQPFQPPSRNPALTCGLQARDRRPQHRADGAIELAPREGAPGARGLEVHKRCFWEEQVMLRNGMDTLQFSPFLNSDVNDWTRAFERIRHVIETTA